MIFSGRTKADIQNSLQVPFSINKTKTLAKYHLWFMFNIGCALLCVFLVYTAFYFILCGHFVMVPSNLSLFRSDSVKDEELP